MLKTGYRPTPIIAILRKADVLIGQGKTVAEGVKALGVTEVTHPIPLTRESVHHHAGLGPNHRDRLFRILRRRVLAVRAFCS